MDLTAQSSLPYVIIHESLSKKHRSVQWLIVILVIFAYIWNSKRGYGFSDGREVGFAETAKIFYQMFDIFCLNRFWLQKRYYSNTSFIALRVTQATASNVYYILWQYREG